MKSVDHDGGHGNGRQGKLSALTSRLTAPERTELAELEKVIEKGWKPFLSVGSALLKIRDRQLHKEYGSFEAYCRTRWGFGRGYAYRLMNASSVATLLSNHGRTKIPGCESHLRALTNLKPAVAEAAWKRTCELAGERAVTAELVQTAIAEVTTKPGSPEKLRGPRQSPPGFGRALKFIDRAATAAKNGDLKMVTTLLEKLRRCLLAA